MGLADLTVERSGGSLVRRKGIYVVQLEGSFEKMGTQHGELAASVCGDVVPRYMYDLIEKLIAHAAPHIAGAAANGIKRLFHRANRDNIGDDMQAHLGALAKSLGYDPLFAERLFLVPDIVHYLAGRNYSTLGLPPLPPMCSAFYADGKATKNGKLIVGRNFDFFGRGAWNANNALVVMKPNNGQRFCWIGALGISASGQGFNESGIIVGLHTKFNKDLSLKGTPLFKIVHEILAKCKSLDEAVKVIKDSRPRISGLSIFVVDSKNRDAAVVGFSARHEEVLRPADGFLVRTNHYTTPELQRFEVAPHPWRRNSYGRFRRVTEQIEARQGKLTERDATKILSDCFDPFEGRKRVAGSIIAGANNVQSMVISPDDDALWLADGDYPVCHSNVFHGFSLSALLDGDVENYLIDDIPGGKQLNKTEREALHEYEEAWSAYMDNLDSSRAISHLLRAHEILPHEPIFPRLAGIILMKEKRLETALPLLVKNTEYDYNDKLMHGEALIWLGRCYDLMDKRGDAVFAYNKAALLNVSPLSEAAVKHRRKPFTKLELFSVAPEFIVGTGIAKY